MKIGNAIIQKSKISENDKNCFCFSYKGHDIEVYTDHGCGEAEDEDETRYFIDSRTHKGETVFIDYFDCENIIDAIKHAIEQSDLIPTPKNS